MVNVALIGCGRIGQRHLESLLELNDSEFHIQVYDKYVKKESSMFVDNIKDLSNDIDICIVATKSDVRKSVVEELLSKKNIKNFILEKVAFQSVRDCLDIIKLTEEKNVNCYVNCPLRLQPVYEAVGDNLDLTKPTKFIYEYSDDFKISSSFIHILDLFCYYCDDYNINIHNNLDNVIDSVKHKGFVDFTGELYVTNSSGHSLLLKKGKNKFTEVLKVENDNVKIYATEGEDSENDSDERISKIIINEKDEYSFPFYWQSYLTQGYMYDLYNFNTCRLPNLIDSFLVHKPMIDTFNKFLSDKKGEVITVCPIT
tara:strand:- start:94 stop:1032 length:939 start_codon:yes stop_codon:yes gene_type:complete